MKVALVQCPVWGTYDPPLSLAQLSSCLKKVGHETLSIDLNIELYLNRSENYKFIWAWEQCSFWFDEALVDSFFRDNKKLINNCIDRIFNNGTRIVCFSVTNANIIPTLKLATLLKERNDKLVIIAGGPLFLEYNPIEKVLKKECIDIVVYGEGEVTICEIVQKIEAGENLGACLGVAFRNKRRVVINKPRPYITNLDDLPFLDFSDLDLDNYDDPHHVPFMASRGCIFRCVFCSSREYWKGYRAMSGKRIFDEIKYHYFRSDKKIKHIDFLDLLINGNIRSLVEFCDLISQAYLDINWSANAIIRPDMTWEVLKKLKKSGCNHLIYGIESGSQKILDKMKKNYKIKDAGAVLKATHDAGIMVTANFMFGFPGEEKEDFGLTLDFIKRNAKWLDRVYPSRTFCALEQNSYLLNNYNQFGIKHGFSSHLFWESTDGLNTYPVRLQRCGEFSKKAEELGIEVGCGVQSTLELDNWLNLAQYYEARKELKNTLEAYLNYFKIDSKNEFVRKKLLECLRLIKNQKNYAGIELSLMDRLSNAIKNIRPVKDFNDLASCQQENISLGDKEYEQEMVTLNSTPKFIFIQVAGPCNSSCVFCSRGKNFEIFDLEIFRKRFEDKLRFPLSRAEQIMLTGSGEFLQLPQANKILDYFDTNFPHVAKAFSTNGSSLVPWVCDKIINSQSRYTIHISLHASNSKLHNILTRSDNFDKILGNIRHLIKLKKDMKKGSPLINLVFVVTTLNIEDLPDFITLAHKLGVEGVICYYNYIYTASQKYLSCFFKQDFTNKIFSEAEELAGKLNLSIKLPPKFKQKTYPAPAICREPFNQIMLTPEGHVLPCDASEDCSERLVESKDFFDVWNGDYYQCLRRMLIEGAASCLTHCLRANSRTVNDFKSHVIYRGKKEEISLSWGDDF